MSLENLKSNLKSKFKSINLEHASDEIAVIIADEVNTYIRSLVINVNVNVTGISDPITGAVVGTGTGTGTIA